MASLADDGRRRRDGARVGSPRVGARFGGALVALHASLSCLGVVACSREAKVVRVPAEANLEVYRISCAHSITPCRDKALEVCGGAYDLLESAGAPIEPARVTSAPGPSSTGSRYQRPTWVGSIVVVCGRGTPAEPAPLPERPPESRTPRLPLAHQLCVPGTTQLCLGPGACRGAQACLADGQGYSACDCGEGRGSSQHLDAGAEDTVSPAR
jgi:hypothetical protein